MKKFICRLVGKMLGFYCRFPWHSPFCNHCTAAKHEREGMCYVNHLYKKAYIWAYPEKE